MNLANEYHHSSSVYCGHAAERCSKTTASLGLIAGRWQKYFPRIGYIEAGGSAVCGDRGAED